MIVNVDDKYHYVEERGDELCSLASFENKDISLEDFQ